MSIRDDITTAMKSAMKAGEAGRLSAVRLIMAKLKDADIAGRPNGRDQISEEEITQVLRGMIKQRRESVALYAQGNRQDLVDKENAEIAVIEGFLPAQMDESAIEAAVAQAIAETGAASQKDMGKVMAALKAKHAATLDMARAGAVVKAKLA